MEDRLSTRPYVSRAVRLLSQPRRSPADSALVTAVALRLAALDSDTETAERLVSASDRVVLGVAGLTGEQASSVDWSDTAEALALLIAGRPLGRDHLTSARTTLGSADKVIDLSDRLRRTAEEPLDRDDLGRALAMAVSSPSDVADALLEKDSSTPAQTPTAEDTQQQPAAARPGRRAGAADRGVPLRALDGGAPR